MSQIAPEPDEPEYDEYAWLDLQEALEDRDRKYRAENDPDK